MITVLFYYPNLRNTTVGNSVSETVCSNFPWGHVQWAWRVLWETEAELWTFSNNKIRILERRLQGLDNKKSLVLSGEGAGL